MGGITRYYYRFRRTLGGRVLVLSGSFDAVALPQASRDGKVVSSLSCSVRRVQLFCRNSANGLRDGLQTPANAPDHITHEADRLRGLVTDLNWLTETDHRELRLSLHRGSADELLAAQLDRFYRTDESHGRGTGSDRRRT